MNDNKKIAVNSIYIFIRLCVASLVSIIASRLVLDALGASDFGLYNVVGGIVAMLGVINMAMSTATYRFIATELGRGEGGSLNKVFNVSLSIHIVFALIILVLGLTIGEYYVNHWLNVEPRRLSDARFVFHVSIASICFTTLTVPYHGLLVAYEEFLVMSILDIVANLLRLAAIVVLLYHVPNKLLCYSLIMMGMIVVHHGGNFVYASIRYKKIVRFKRYRDKSLYKEMLSFSGWTSLGAFTNVANTQCTAMIINYFFGTIVNAAFSVANQINGFITMFANSLNTSAVPQITKSLSGGNQGRSVSLTVRISKYTYFMMLMIAFPVLMELDFLLSLWLKQVPEGANIYCVLIVTTGLLVCISQGTGSLIQATGKIKVFQIVSAVITVITLPLGALAFYLGANAYALSGIICLANFGKIFIILLFLKRIIKLNVRETFMPVYSKMAIVTAFLVVVYFIYNPSGFSIVGHVAGFILAFFLCIGLIYCFGLDISERSMLKDFIVGKLRSTLKRSRG